MKTVIRVRVNYTDFFFDCALEAIKFFYLAAAHIEEIHKGSVTLEMFLKKENEDEAE